MTDRRGSSDLGGFLRSALGLRKSDETAAAMPGANVTSGIGEIVHSRPCGPVIECPERGEVSKAYQECIESVCESERRSKKATTYVG